MKTHKTVRFTRAMITKEYEPCWMWSNLLLPRLKGALVVSTDPERNIATAEKMQALWPSFAHTGVDYLAISAGFMAPAAIEAGFCKPGVWGPIADHTSHANANETWLIAQALAMLADAYLSKRGK